MPWTVNPDHGYLDWKDNPGGGGVDLQEINVDAATPPGTDPVVPTAGGVVTMTGGQVSSGTTSNVVRTHSTAANSLTIEVQQTGTAAAENTALNGVAHFNSSQFSVSNGFVSLSGGGLAIDSVAVQTGTSPVVPTVAGLITINGATVAAGINPVRSDGTGANTLAIEVQLSQATAATDATRVGLCNFDSSQFAVDANGFVSLLGGNAAIDSVAVDTSSAPGTNPVLPDANGQITVTGAQVASSTVGANVIRSASLAANTYTIQVQRSGASATADTSLNGVSHYDSDHFDIDSNGFVQLDGTVPITFVEDSGNATASGNTLNVLGGVNCSTTGSGNTVTINVAMDWVEVTGTSVSAAINTSYILNNAGLVTVNLPGTFAVGDEIRLLGKGSGLYVADAPAGDTIHFGAQDTSSGGTLTATNRYDSLHLVGTVANSEWTVFSSNGNFTVA